MQRLYPRPQLIRNNWINLNGKWDFDFDDNIVGIKEKWFKKHNYSKKIIVPFPYQSSLSEISDRSCHDHVWYHTAFEYTNPKNQKVILHFGAIDYQSRIYLNGKLIGSHTGGSTSFSIDITTHIVEGEKQDLTIYVYDPSYDSFISRGKQTWKESPFECFYDRTTGIWQTVWIEAVSMGAIKSLKITPNIDNPNVKFEISSYDNSNKRAVISTTLKDRTIDKREIEFQSKGWTIIDFSKNNLKLWTPETPNLYDVSVKVYHNDILIDEITSYFGMRKISVENNKIMLNNKPYYLRLILDQGYYHDGLISYSNEESLLNDIKLSKAMGFNGCRKHAKIEAERFMYYADKEGYLVSLEMPSAYSYKASKAFIDEWTEAIERDYNHPSLFMYVPFNESWGVRKIKENKEIQQYVNGFYYLTKSLDPTRIVSSNDGWEQTITDVCAIHTYIHGKIDDLKQHEIYHKSITDKNSILSSIHTEGDKDIYVDGYQYKDEPIIISEFGGVSFANNRQDGWGYTGVSNKEDFLSEIKRIFKVIHESKLIAGFCYTQLTDVEQEINGLLDYYRNEKIDIEEIKKVICNL